MRWWIGFDNTQREVSHRKVDLKKSAFRISGVALLRIALGLSVFLLAAGVAFYFEQYPQMWLAIIFGVSISAWQLLFMGTDQAQRMRQRSALLTFTGKQRYYFSQFFGPSS